MKILWQGTDVLMMKDLSKLKIKKRFFWIVIRLIVKFLDSFLTITHMTNATWLKEELEQIGMKSPVEIMLTPVRHTTPYPKKPHKNINVLYYKPISKNTKLRDWLYGIDLIDKLKKEYSDRINFIEVDYSQNMADVFPIIDFYIRPNRHDGYSRLIRECDIQNIPYYWTHQDPDYNEMEKQIKALERLT